MIDYRVGDTRDLTADLPDGSVHLVASSPPFVALRSYLPADHPDKHREIGSEPDPATFLDTLLALTAEWGRVLAPWGSLAIELGDTYAGSGGGGGDYLEGGMREGQQQFAGSAASMRESNAAHWRQKNAAKAEWPRAKCLALVPQAYALSLAYGRNILTGQPSPAGQWLVRNMVVWHRPNPAVGALGDKYRPSTSYITVATRSSGRWFDLTAVRTEYRAPKNNEASLKRGAPTMPLPAKGLNMDRGDLGASNFYSPHGGAPPLDCWFDEHDTWTITTQPSRLAHYAMWPPKLAERLVLSMCPEWVCRVCGQPRRRVEKVDGLRGCDILAVNGKNERGSGLQGARPPMPDITRTTLGWSDCGHGSVRCRRCKVLVPFEDAVRRSRQEPRSEAQVSDEALLGEPVEGASGQEEVPRDLCGVSGGISGTHGDQPSVLAELFGATGSHGGQGEHDRGDRSGQSIVEGRGADSQGRLPNDLGASWHARSTGERSHDGAQSGDAESPRPPAGEVGDRSSPQRDQGRQQNRESGSRNSSKARWDGHLPSLHGDVPGELTCRHCGSDEIEYVADNYGPGVVLDPFAGTGTTLCVADLHNRTGIGFDLDPKNRSLVAPRMDEVRRALFGVKPQLPGQESLFDGVMG